MSILEMDRNLNMHSSSVNRNFPELRINTWLELEVFWVRSFQRIMNY